MKTFRIAVCTGLAALAAAALAAPLKLDRAHSSVSAVFRQMNVPVEAPFQRFAASVEFDPAHPQDGKASVTVETASIDLGEADYNQEVAGKDWFDAARFPKASFVSTSIRPAATGTFKVTGKLTLKGRSAEVSFPLKLSTVAGQQVFEGQLPIRRLAFAIGEGEWKDTGMVADEVVIKFRIAAGK